MPMTTEQAEKWSKTRELGRSKYIWKYGVIRWGVVVGIVWSMAMAGFHDWKRFLFLLTLAIPGFGFAGYMLGSWTWQMREQEYKKIKKPE